MKIVTCPKGGRIPEGYCKESCLNYYPVPQKGRLTSLQRPLGKFCIKEGQTRSKIIDFRETNLSEFGRKKKVAMNDY